ncbi:MAG: T9SS type A sorting domain-containing protein, partial [Bacteroidetes bacterium]|nr:T9SS type A sorting domain-containing protein [Bacteroidota bacterium]
VCRVTSSIVPVLEIYSRPLHLFVEGSLSVDRQTDGFPSTFSLEQNYPNPFNPVTTIGFQIADYGLVTLKVFDLLGREVATLVNEVMEPGRYERVFSAKGGSASGENLASGVYLYQLKARSFVQTRKFLLVR